ncbi:MAG: DEAD/DEAH box helicase [Candidatus Bipolaricaulia bacterium]
MSVQLKYEGGTIAITAPQHAESLPLAVSLQSWVKWDARSQTYRALAFRYYELLQILKSERIPFEDRVLNLLPSPSLDPDTFASDSDSPPVIELRDYQQEALERWLTDGQGRGTVELPTGAGKTIIALGAIARLKCATFIVVPTLDLVEQWKRVLSQSGFEPIGELTGQEKQLEAITVATYDSAYIHADKFGNRFPLIVFDEVHHLPSPGYRHIAEFFASPYRLGLTATYEREDDLHEVLSELLGGVIFEVHVEELAGTHLSRYALERIYVDLTPEEREDYDKAQDVFQGYLKKRRIRIRHPRDFEKLVYRSGGDSEAWRAIRARHQAVQIAFNAKHKLDALRTLLDTHRGDRIIIFTRFNDLVYRISQEFFIPCITYKTGREERREVLEGFRDGVYPAIASSQVLDEGVDVPEANVGILLSGTGSSREFIQRLGRLLRPREGKQAILYEIVSRGTGEEQTASRRKRKLRSKSKSKKES